MKLGFADVSELLETDVFTSQDTVNIREAKFHSRNPFLLILLDQVISLYHLTCLLEP